MSVWTLWVSTGWAQYHLPAGSLLVKADSTSYAQAVEVTPGSFVVYSPLDQLIPLFNPSTSDSERVTLSTTPDLTSWLSQYFTNITSVYSYQVPLYVSYAYLLNSYTQDPDGRFEMSWTTPVEAAYCHDISISGTTEFGPNFSRRNGVDLISVPGTRVTDSGLDSNHSSLTGGTNRARVFAMSITTERPPDTLTFSGGPKISIDPGGILYGAATATIPSLSRANYLSLFNPQPVGVSSTLNIYPAITFTTEQNTVYGIQAASSPGGPFTELSQITGTGSTYRFIDDRPLTSRQFYQVVK
ncbi:MAG: hypothetical protein AAFY98_10260 [Verrucomicrobiota bacterium]